MTTAKECMAALARYSSPEKAAFAQHFFKTAPGHYGEGDEFLGLRVPEIREVCKAFKDLPLPEVQKLLDSNIHEHRLAAVILLVNQYKKADANKRQDIFDLYLKNVLRGRVNNWDIVDSSAPYIVGPHLEHGDRTLLLELVKSSDLWQKRVGILSAFWFLRRGDPGTTLELAEVLLHDSHDLIQKAVGWQLRELGKRVDRQLLLQFLDKHAATMPRTTLRYAIEHLPPAQRARYLAAKHSDRL
jgi:3-methyladenine DNA glycosylase AlkD